MGAGCIGTEEEGRADKSGKEWKRWKEGRSERRCLCVDPKRRGVRLGGVGWSVDAARSFSIDGLSEPPFYRVSTANP